MADQPKNAKYMSLEEWKTARREVIDAARSAASEPTPRRERPELHAMNPDVTPAQFDKLKRDAIRKDHVDYEHRSHLQTIADLKDRGKRRF